MLILLTVLDISVLYENESYVLKLKFKVSVSTSIIFLSKTLIGLKFLLIKNLSLLVKTLLTYFGPTLA